VQSGAGSPRSQTWGVGGFGEFDKNSAVKFGHAMQSYFDIALQRETV